MFPQLYTALVPHVMRLVAIGKDPLPPHHGNVFKPQPELDAVQGGWRRPWRLATTAALAVTAASTAVWDAAHDACSTAPT
jgi:hypothetical protein